MFGIPLMFMCLTYTGDLLADAFISLYSKIVNCISRQFYRDRMNACSPSSTRQSFEQTDVSEEKPESQFLSTSLSFSLIGKKHVMCRLLPH